MVAILESLRRMSGPGLAGMVALSFAVCASACAGSTGDGDRGAGGGGGTIEPHEAGTCAAPLDFDALREYHGSSPFVRASIAAGKAELAGSCGGEGKEQVVHWSAPRAGTVILRLANPDPSLTVHVRRSCADPGSEAACVGGDQRVQLTMESGEPLFVIVDSPRESAANFELELVFQPSELEEGEVCRLDASTGPCAAGLYCDKKEGKCMLGIPPVLHSVLASAHDDVVRFRVRGSSQTRNVYATGFRFFDEAHQPVLVWGQEEVFADIIEQVMGKEEINADSWVDHAALPGAVSVEVRLIDTGDLSSGSLEVPILSPPIVGEGEVCDPLVFFGLCDEGLVCPARKASPRCELAVTPVLTSVSGIWNQEEETLVLTLSGEDPNLDVDSFRALFFDVDDQLIAVDGADEDGAVEFVGRRASHLDVDPFTAVRGFSRLNRPRFTVEVSRVEAMAIDLAGLTSDWLSGEITAETK